MGKRRRIPQDLMWTILNENLAAAEEERALSESPGSSGTTVSWDENPERIGMTFNLSRQLGTELERLRHEFLREGEARLSRSEVVEAALRIAVEDTRENGEESEISHRLRDNGATMKKTFGGPLTRRSVDESGWIFETTHDENGEIIDEDVVGTVAELPILDEYMDDKGRLISLAKDDFGNTFERIMDESLNTLGTRLLQNSDAAGRETVNRKK